MNEKTRLELLEELVEQDPNDEFSRYGLALEYQKVGKPEKAFEEFNALIQRHPDYVPDYFMSGQYLYEEGEEEQAIQRIEQGIEVARRVGDNHALGEMQDFLASIQ